MKAVIIKEMNVDDTIKEGREEKERKGGGKKKNGEDERRTRKINREREE